MLRSRSYTVRVALGCALLCAHGHAAAPADPPVADDEYHFVVLGDSQFNDPGAFNRMVDDIVHLQPAFVVQVGDMIDGYRNDVGEVAAEWRRFRRQIAPLGAIPYYPVPGNHDLYNGERRADRALTSLYEREWGATRYAFRYRNALFVVLNTDAPDSERRIGPEQRRWLAATLEADASEHVFVFMHRPLLDLEDADGLHGLLRRYPVRYVFYGHHHHYHEFVRDGIGYVMTNAAADMGTAFDEAGSFHHFLHVSVRDAAVRYAVIRADALEAPGFVVPEDNYDLYALTRRLAPETVTLERTGTDRWTITVPLENPTGRLLTVYASCTSEDERWQFAPARLAPVTMAPRATAALVVETWHTAERPSDFSPTCAIRVPFQTRAGSWLQHRTTVTTREPEG